MYYKINNFMLSCEYFTDYDSGRNFWGDEADIYTYKKDENYYKIICCHCGGKYPNYTFYKNDDIFKDYEEYKFNSLEEFKEKFNEM